MGQTGTLEGRGVDSPIAGHVMAKTGTMSGVSNISGYLETEKGHHLVFSIMSNGTTQSIINLRQAQDRMLNLMYEML